jgi:CRP-like cAMP-binding protein
MPTEASLLRQPFQAPRTVQQAIGRIGAAKSIKTDAVLFRQGDPVKGVFLIRSGKIALTLANGRKQKHCWIADAGSVLGLPATVRNKNYSLTAKAVEDSKLTFVSRTKMQRLLLSDAILCLETVRILASEVRSMRLKR